MTDTRRVPARLRKPTYLKHTPLRRSTKPIRKLGRVGRQRKIGMDAARSAYHAKFGYTTAEGDKLAPCQLCRKNVIFHLHHKNKKSDGGDEQPENLIALCNFHHIKIVHNPRDSRMFEAVRDSGANVINGLGLIINWEAMPKAT